MNGASLLPSRRPETPRNGRGSTNNEKEHGRDDRIIILPHFPFVHTPVPNDPSKAPKTIKNGNGPRFLLHQPTNQSPHPPHRGMGVPVIPIHFVDGGLLLCSSSSSGDGGLLLCSSSSSWGGVLGVLGVCVVGCANRFIEEVYGYGVSG